MAAALLRRVLAIFVGLGDLLAAHPILGTIYLMTFGALGALTIWFLWRSETKRAFWCATAAILVEFLFSWGDDTFTHIYRIAALADQVRHGVLSQFLVNPTTGETLPVFVYYNVLPYVIPTVLNWWPSCSSPPTTSIACGRRAARWPSCGSTAWCRGS
jgi:uncharacterized membrane protein